MIILLSATYKHHLDHLHPPTSHTFSLFLSVITFPPLVAQLCRDHNRPWIPIRREMGVRVRALCVCVGVVQKSCVPEKLRATEAWPAFPPALSGAAVIHLVPPPSHPTLRCTSICRYASSTRLFRSFSSLLLASFLPAPPDLVLVIHM